ncbi:MAG: hypothetical protein F6K10_21585 [Moorea sp. SIO2B7]|nr:hypothetical protein [Moorena sp. SIO2B7]
MLFTLIDKLGEWNPQLFRELKGRFKVRNLVITIGCALMFQGIILLLCSEQDCLASNSYSCTEFDWEIQWQYLFVTLNWMLPLTLLVGGVYQIINDLAKEEYKGTLNFIRLSPQSSQSILTGKILGVPALIYLGVFLVIPLHFVSALAAGLPLGWILAFYTLWAAACSLFYSAACLYSLMCSSQNNSQLNHNSLAGLGILVALSAGSPLISMIHYSFELYQSSELRHWYWFFLPLGNKPLLTYIWMMITFSVATHWIWQGVNRRFGNPNKTLISKSQSYWLVACFQIWLLGFFLPASNSFVSQSYLIIGFTFVFFLSPFLFLILIAALSPHRQNLLDWARYRHQINSERKRSLVKELIWGEKSPALVAIAINLLITLVIWLPWILLLPESAYRQSDLPIQEAIMGLFLTLNLILIYGAIAQIMLFMKTSKRGIWAASTLITVMVLPMLLVGLLALEKMKIPFLWTLSPMPILVFMNGSTLTALLGLLSQLGILGLLTWRLTRQLQKAGESASKALFAANYSTGMSTLN